MKKVLVSLLFVVVSTVLFAGPKEDMVGYYKADVVAFKKKLEEQIATMPEEQKAMAAAQLPMMLKMFENMLVQFTATESSAWMMGQPKKTTAYEVEGVEGNVVTIKDENSTSKFTVTEGAIEIATPGGAMRFIKIEEKEAKEIIARLEAAAEAKKAAEPAKEEVVAPAEETVEEPAEAEMK